MPTLVAIDIAGEELTFVTAEASRAAGISIVDKTKLHLRDLDELLKRSEVSHSVIANPVDPDTSAKVIGGFESGEQPSEDSATVPISESDAGVTTNGHDTGTFSIHKLVKREVDFTLATIRAEQVIFEYLKLPFNDPRRVDQIAPIQIQDLLPFDLDQFIVDHLVLGKSAAGDYDILSGVVPQETVASALENLLRIDSNPKILTTKASALSALTNLFPEVLRGTYGLLVIDSNQASLALYFDSQLKLLRELPIGNRSGAATDSGDLSIYRDLFRDIRCSISKFEAEVGTELPVIHLVGNEQFVGEVSKLAQIPFTPLDLSSRINVAPELSLDPNHFSWAIGLFANETLTSRSPRGTASNRLINFRRGRFAFKQAWGNLIAALEEEWEWIAFAAIGALLWLGSTIYAANHSLAVIENEMATQTAIAMPGETVPRGKEVAFVTEKLNQVKTQLQGLGSLASPSPLDSLKTLSAAIPKNLEVTFESLRFGNKGITISGTVPDLPTYGKLDTVLKNQAEKREKFCEATSQPKSGIGGARKVRFEAELTFCE